MEPWKGFSRRSIHAPFSSLIVLFFAWKALLLAVAFCSPGPGYDTSAQIIFGAPLDERAGLAQKLVRWDAIYYTSIATRGYTHEQEWAFGWGFTRLLAFLADYIPFTASKLLNVAYYGMIVANLSHLISVLVLYCIAIELPLCRKSRRTQFAFIAAVCQILSPAGLFLCAPYGEALFSLLSFLSLWMYTLSHTQGNEVPYTSQHDVYLVLSGICFGLSSTIRGNGIFSGIIYAYDAVLWGASLLERLGFPFLILILPSHIQKHVRLFQWRRLPATIVAGALVGIGFVVPQYIAYKEYCSEDLETRQPWCSKLPPSIYSWVQNHYWNVGFLKYWTVSNIPLFLLAAPMLYLLSRSALLAVTEKCSNHNLSTSQAKKASAKGRAETHQNAMLFRLALPQLLLVALALTTFHVQIITRLSSGYPLWCLIFARDIVNGPIAVQAPSKKKWWHLDAYQIANWTVRWMVMYALIQGALFASFLPPA
ncbi:hypothetical protein EJ08DRAFT_466941 [Tothia fuscella]|uniref:GPI mannosyltransferase 2 n=1 Tax=Tothia fuscella TaxID=1048955 RepID=A0A9P4U244_9PEZI|nr:hypothetical protein EJ08DRAFT_466941 [Tothia fuscella]